jgi:hypothetical protein
MFKITLGDVRILPGEQAVMKAAFDIKGRANRQPEKGFHGASSTTKLHEHMLKLKPTFPQWGGSFAASKTVLNTKSAWVFGCLVCLEYSGYQMNCRSEKGPGT